MDQRKAIPSMFHRRLLLLAGVFALLLTTLGAQMIRLAVIEGHQHRAAAESKLDRRDFLPTWRGRIFDRHGRVLAIDRASDDLAIEYDVITGGWARAQAYAAARKAVGRAKWSSLSPQERETLIGEILPEYRRRIDDLYATLCHTADIAPDELQRRLDVIKANVQSSAAAIWERQRMEEQERFGITEAEFTPRPIEAQKEAHVVIPRLQPSAAFEFRRVADQYPGMIEVKASRRREYPWLTANVPLNRNSLPSEIRRNEVQVITVSGVADHILGSVRDQVWAQDVERRPFMLKDGPLDLGGYRPGDSVGARGVEAVFERSLRGTRGEVRQRLDTSEKIRTEAVPGRDLHLTIDIALQARVQAAMTHEFGLTVVHEWQHNALALGTPLNAAAAVVEIETGEIMAMVTMPTMAMGERMSPAEKERNTPVVNRACEAIYAPGSILKPLTLAAAVTEGVHRLDSPIDCTGYYFEKAKDSARCWIYRPRYGMQTHEPLLAAEALARSCNIFFYTLADHLGLPRLRKWLSAFGMSYVLDIGLTARDAQGATLIAGESGGQLPSDAQVSAWQSAGQLAFNETIMGIGQGPLAWTPLHAANAYATLARGGVIRDATLVVDDPRGMRPQRHVDLNLSPQLVQTAIEGLRQSVEETHGTGHHISYEGRPWEVILNSEGVTVWAKTGTAQAPLTGDVNGDGRTDNLDRLDHSWFVGMLGPKGGQPLFAIAVLVEFGGSGGRTAGPIANQVIRALQTEGYLPGDPNAPPPPAGRSIGEQPEDVGGGD